MRFSFNKPEVQHKSNNGEYCNDLKAVEKFIVDSIQTLTAIVNRGQSCARTYPGIDSNEKAAISTNSSDITLLPSALIFILS